MPLIKARMIATAMLFSGDELLMMKRSPHRTLSPGMWAVVGGHLEPPELNDPKAAALREIFEETGLLPTELEDLRLRYILLRLNENEVRQQFIYTAAAARRDVSQTREGELFWIPREQVLNRDIPFIFRAVLAHYFAEEHVAAEVWVGVAGFTEEGGPTVRFVPLQDPLQN